MDEIIVVVAGLAVYFIPTFIAHHRDHRNVLAIGALNVLFGWTGIGWGVALIWALTGNVHDSGIGLGPSAGLAKPQDRTEDTVTTRENASHDSTAELAQDDTSPGNSGCVTVACPNCHNQEDVPQNQTLEPSCYRGFTATKSFWEHRLKMKCARCSHRFYFAPDLHWR